MWDLRLKEEYMYDVVLEDDQALPTEEIRWLLLVKVHMDREFSNFSFFKKHVGHMGSSQRCKDQTIVT